MRGVAGNFAGRLLAARQSAEGKNIRDQLGAAPAQCPAPHGRLSFGHGGWPHYVPVVATNPNGFGFEKADLRSLLYRAQHDGRQFPASDLPLLFHN